MGLKDRLKTPEEPIVIKEEIRELIKEDENLARLFLTKISGYLWREWKEVLNTEGYSWVNFLRRTSLIGKEISDWVMDRIGWEEFIKKLKETIDSPYGSFFMQVKNRR